MNIVKKIKAERIKELKTCFLEALKNNTTESNNQEEIKFNFCIPFQKSAEIAKNKIIMLEEVLCDDGYDIISIDKKEKDKINNCWIYTARMTKNIMENNKKEESCDSEKEFLEEAINSFEQGVQNLINTSDTKFFEKYILTGCHNDSKVIIKIKINHNEKNKEKLNNKIKLLEQELKNKYENVKSIKIKEFMPNEYVELEITIGMYF